MKTTANSIAVIMAVIVAMEAEPLGEEERDEGHTSGWYSFHSEGLGIAECTNHGGPSVISSCPHTPLTHSAVPSHPTASTTAMVIVITTAIVSAVTFACYDGTKRREVKADDVVEDFKLARERAGMPRGSEASSSPKMLSRARTRKRGQRNMFAAMRMGLVFLCIVSYYCGLSGLSGNRRTSNTLQGSRGVIIKGPRILNRRLPLLRSVRTEMDASAKERFGALHVLYDVTWSLARNRLLRRRHRKRLLNTPDGQKAEANQSFKGKTCVITGANTGIGREAALGLAARGARVVLACRDAKKAKDAVSYIKNEVGEGALVDAVELDLASLSSVDGFVSELHKKAPNISILINNAGYGGGGAGGITKDGIELNFGVNFLGHFKLTMLLLPALLAGAVETGEISRVINLSSGVHWLASYKLNELDSTVWRKTDRELDGGEYKRSKLFMHVLTRSLNKRLEALDVSDKIISHSVNPGAVASDIWRYSPEKSKWQAREIYPRIFKTCEQGSLFIDEKSRRFSRLADDLAVSEWLWKTAINATNVDFHIS
eukprot:jgi/Bigna1/131336/aug1.14_g6044